VTIERISPETIYLRGSTVWFRVCLAYSPPTAFSLAITTSDPQIARDQDLSSTMFDIPAGAAGQDLCKLISLTGRSFPGNAGLGSVMLKVRHSDEDIFSDPIEFVTDLPTPTEEPLTPTWTPSITPGPTSTPTETATPFNPPTATPTASPVELVTITLVGEETQFPNSGSVQFVVCYSLTAGAAEFLQFSSETAVVFDQDIVPKDGAVMNPGQCVTVTMNGRDGRFGNGDARLLVKIEQDIVATSITVHFGT